MADSEYTAWTPEQTKYYHDATLVHEAYRTHLGLLQRYRGTLYWKKVGAAEYLFHLTQGKAKAQSLGPRTPETEKRLLIWRAERDAADAAFAAAAKRMEEQRRYSRAARLGRLDRTAAQILRRLEKAGVARHFAVVGTHALYGYEAMAGVRFNDGMTATRDFDLLWDARLGIVFADIDGEATSGFMDVLKKVDATFTRNEERTFQAINSQGFAVEILRPEEPAIPPLMTPTDRINPMPLAGLDLLLTPPLCRVVVIDVEHYPIEIQVPDPAAFVLHKLWVSRRMDRRPDKAARDRMQALGLAALIADRLPTYGFDVDRIQDWPEALVDRLVELPSSSS